MRLVTAFAVWAVFSCSQDQEQTQLEPLEVVVLPEFRNPPAPIEPVEESAPAGIPAEEAAGTFTVEVSPTELWTVPAEGGLEATVLALHRVCASEAEFVSVEDCRGIWQVVHAIRARHCDRDRSPRITECENGEETALSAMRRMSRYATGILPAKTPRQRWVQQVTLECDEPSLFPRSRHWEGLRDRCLAQAEAVRKLVTGEDSRPLTRATPIAWGGRCEDHCSDPTDRSTCRATGACDDRIACRRGLRRIEGTPTRNAFWCRPGSAGCPEGIEPSCRALGL